MPGKTLIKTELIILTNTEILLFRISKVFLADKNAVAVTS